jgi:uncharacterized repeat protein (TIGR04076 family)
MSRRLQLTVERLNYSACGFRVGDSIELHDDVFTLPDGQGFCFYALGTILPHITGRLAQGDGEQWLASEPQVLCPDPPEGVVFRLRSLG